ncbi:hypothetical protein [Pseudomonas sp. EL_65y_Pfl2_R95]|uniref:hypothetical protein n=1 Tax=Pseudomonas sp. EL_65y_Pfl2_R95 TaxID=3088698 RepID=UPI0030D8C441
MDNLISIILLVLSVIWSAIVAIFGWGLDHFFEIVVLLGVFIYLPSCMPSRGEDDQLYAVLVRLEEISGRLDELNSHNDSISRDDSSYHEEYQSRLADEEPNPGKPAKPYPY